MLFRSVLRTIELILGLAPLNLGDGLAAPMVGLFSPVADSTPYRPPADSALLVPADRELSRSLR